MLLVFMLLRRALSNSANHNSGAASVHKLCDFGGANRA